MIDTVILTLPKNKAIMTDALTDGLRPWDLQGRTAVYDKYVKNPSPKDAASGQYFPRLTGYHRKGGGLTWDSTLRIEFSAPKLLFQNNLDELTNAQFDDVVRTLRDRLQKMGVMILTRDLEAATVTAAHFSKNIELQNGYTAQYVIGELGKINLNKHFDITRARYMNDGQSLYAYTTAYSLVLYDKVADLARGPKRAIDKNQPTQQLNLFEQLNKSREILRFEVRLSQKQKMNSLFKQLGFKDNPTFKDVFSNHKSKAVLTHYWDTMIAGDGVALFAHHLTPKDLLKQVLIADRAAKGKTAIYLTGLLLLAREGAGLRELRAMLSKRANDRTWYRLVADLRAVTADLSKLRPREWYEQVRQALADYRPFRLENREICYVKNSKV